MKKRIISAGIALAIFIPLIIIGGIAFEIGATLLSILAVRELFHLIRKDSKIPTLIEIISYVLTGTIVLSSDMFLAAIAVTFIFTFMPLIFIKKEQYNFDSAIKVFGSILFIGYCFYVMDNIRLSSLEEFIFILSVSFATDTFAYFGGMFFGKNKLLERISPNKTWEGSIIGTFAGVLIPTLVYIFMVNPSESVFIVILISVILSITAQFGDLLFSSIKRNYGTKDFSNIMPGHGGVLDRLDSLILISLVYTIIKTLFL